MTMAAAIESRTAEATAWSKASRIASVDILHDLARPKAIWRGLEDAAVLSRHISGSISSAPGNGRSERAKSLAAFHRRRL